MAVNGTPVLPVAPAATGALLRSNLVDGRLAGEPRLDQQRAADLAGASLSSTCRHAGSQTSIGCMAKIGRNQPCPCGSGKKYKRCCWGKEGRSAQPTTTSAAFSEPTAGMNWVVTDDDPLCRLSNRIVELINAGRLGDAEQAWKELNCEFPDEIDPIERKAMLLEARGNHRDAASYYRRAAQYTRTHDGFESETTEFYDQQAARLENTDPSDG